jgi:shikimate kinase / 3-dehydroquinate synthase
MRVFLSGPMGSGKSMLAQALAARAGVPAFDLDALITQQTGSDVPALFAARGEAAFRALERDTLHALLAQHPRGVFALGGGTVTNLALRRELLREGTLITLRAPIAELARRVGSGAGRPLLAGQDVAARLRELVDQRADAYAECHAELDTNGRQGSELAAEVLRVVADAPIVVPLGMRSYRVEVGRGVRARLPKRVSAVARSPRVALVSNHIVEPLWGKPLAAALRDAGRDVVPIVLPDGEQHKTLSSVERIWEAALQAGIDRGGVFVGVGGGVVGDLSAFAASTFLRGVAAGHVPTTLLAMVDSAIGGKTGFDTRHGKNLIGSFHQPSFVLCDVDVLSTLPAAERTAGLAEVIKSAWLDGEDAVALIERDREALRAGDADATVRAIRMSAALKARIVTEDERESGARALLNLGHTLGHAIEASLGYSGMRHGEAVSLGMVAAFRLSVRAGHASAAEAERATRLLADVGLPTDVGPYLNARVLSFIGADKKRRADSITFVLPAGPGRVELRPLPVADLPSLLAG